MAAPFDQIKTVVGMGSALPGPLGTGATTLSGIIPSQAPVTPPSGGGIPQPPSGGGTPTPPPGTETFANIVLVPAGTVAGAVSDAASAFSQAGQSYATQVQAIGAGFQGAGAGFGADLMTAFANGQNTAQQQAAIFQNNMTDFSQGLGRTVGGYSAIVGDRVAFAINTAQTDLLVGTNAVVANINLVVGAIEMGSASANAVAAELDATAVALAGGQNVFLSGFAGGQAIVTGIADVPAHSTIPASVGDLASAVAHGAAGIGGSLAQGGLSVYEAGAANFPPNSSGFAGSAVNFLGAVSNAGVGHDGVLTQIGAAAADVAQGAVSTAQSGIDTAASLVSTVTGSVSGTLVPAAFSVPAAIVGTLSGQDPTGVFTQIQGPFNSGSTQVEGGVNTLTTAVGGGADMVFGAAQGGIAGVPSAFSSGFNTGADTLATQLHTIASTISSQHFPPAGFPPAGLPPGLPVA